MRTPIANSACLLLIALSLLGGRCSEPIGGIAPPEGDTDTDADADSDTDTDTDLPADADGDGYASDVDCDDGDATVHPGADEICDEQDNDCDGLVDGQDGDLLDGSTWYQDADGDGYGDAAVSDYRCSQPSGFVSAPTDCDDGDATVHPGADEICDEQDNDCDGLVDGQDPDLTGGSDWFEDADGDSYGDAASSLHACDEHWGYVADDGDCDDDDDTVHPGADEICDEQDNDCDGLVDGQDSDLSDGTSWYQDADGDGYGDATVSDYRCSRPSGYVADDSDCDDGGDTVHPGADEICDEQDNDCDGLTDGQDSDLSDGSTWYQDADGDGYGDASVSDYRCSQPTGYVTTCCDCDDGDASVTSCGDWADDGSICSSLMGGDDGLVPTWTGDCDTSLGYVQYGDHCYYGVTTYTIWEDARASCLAAGGYLATVTNSGENAVVEALNNRPFLGACDYDSEGAWTWITGEAWSYTNWVSGAPNNSGDEDCLEMYATTTGGPWNDIWCSSDPWNEGYVCEFEGIVEAEEDTGVLEDPGSLEDTGGASSSCAPIMDTDFTAECSS
jgi:hypothetical protein